MIAMTDQKARLLDLVTGVLEMTRDGNRDIGEVSQVLQVIKDDPNFVTRFFTNGADLVSLTGELRVQIPALQRPTLTELRAKYSWVKSIERDNSPARTTSRSLQPARLHPPRRM